MPDSLFKNTSDFSVGVVNVDNVDGSYTDARHTLIEETEVGREFYNQAGAVGVVNGRGTFAGAICYVGVGPLPTKARKSRSHTRTPPVHSGAKPKRRRPLLQNTSDSHSGAVRPDRSGSGSTFFNHTEAFEVDTISIRNTTGDFIDQRTTEVRKKCLYERHYDQQGAVGVVNGRGRLSGVISYGWQKERNNASNLRLSSSEEEESESEEETSDDRSCGVGGAYYNQRGAVGVINDRGRFSGTVNFGIGPCRRQAKERARKNLPLTPGGRSPSSHGESDAPSEFGSISEEPQPLVQPSPPVQVVHSASRDLNPFHQHYGRNSLPLSNISPQVHEMYRIERCSPHDPSYLGAQVFQRGRSWTSPDLGLQATPNPGEVSQHHTPRTPQNRLDTRGYVDRNPFRRMTAPA